MIVINKKAIEPYKYNVNLVDQWLAKQRLSEFENSKKLYAKFNNSHIGQLGIKQFISVILFLKPKAKRLVKYDPMTQRMRYGLKGLNEAN